jgi:hypothetical protein
MPDASVFEYPGMAHHYLAPEIKRLVMLRDTKIRVDIRQLEALPEKLKTA